MIQQHSPDGENQTATEGYEEIIETPPIAELPEADTEIPEDAKPIWFHAEFEDRMELYADIETVAEYFADHRSWYPRCAKPMKAIPLGENAYDLLIGRFGAFGYKVEARIGLNLVPPDDEGVYRIVTVPVPDYTPPGYEVDFQSSMKLVELPVEEFCSDIEIERLGLPSLATAAEWHLDLAVGVKFPQFIKKMSHDLIQRTGDRLLDKIVEQVSRRLTYKTQLDFHTSHDLSFPCQNNRKN